MANTLGVYNPIFYANEALIQLEKALGMASRVHNGFDTERATFNKGDTINIRRPSTFIVGNAPDTAQDVATGTVAITLNQWKEVKFKLLDKELAYTGQRIVVDHIRPAAYALADNIDQALAAEIANVANFALAVASDPIVVADVVAARRALFDAAVPMQEGMLHAMVNGKMEADLLNETAFTQHQGSGDVGVQAQLRGHIGTRYGVEHFANQNEHSYTPGTHSVDLLAVMGAHAKGVSVIDLDAASVTGTLVAGDAIKIAGDSSYVVTATNTASTDVFTNVAISPNLRKAAADNAVVTVSPNDTSPAVKSVYFHRNAFAVAFAKLPDYGEFANQLGAQIATVQDPVTGIALRARMYYVGDSSEMHVALDVLYGVATLDNILAAVLHHD